MCKLNVRVIDYFDVWGNEKDGYEVNNLCQYKDTFVIDDDVIETDAKLFAWLRTIGFLRKGIGCNRLYSDDYYPFIKFSMRSNGCPVGRIEIIENGK